MLFLKITEIKIENLKKAIPYTMYKNDKKVC